MSTPFEFAQKNVLVVGGTSGINRGIAETFARLEARVAVISRSADKVADTVAALLSAGAAAADGASADVRQADALKQAIDALSQAWGQWDLVVSGAAGNFPALATGMSANGFRSVVEIDLLGTFHVMQAVYPHLRKPGASIINISAPQAVIPMAGQSHVCAAKAGVDMITRSLCLEWGAEGVRINSIIPGPIDDTEGMARLAPTPAMRAAVEKSVPLQRMGSTADIANACLFLASDYASYITGAVIPVDGGWAQGGAAVVGAGLAEMLKRS
ncbi:SDR family oxidoreductase [Cellvibrio japonicus]|uniref:Oxidoreductase, short chain dehydrogenase/reductase family n=1 Tax=Cellvibrio japonicus (strain Ueda107) TaxID=498211 RepID=B3PKE1_CELJU|nr:SDR family oxidoreductase [Cellvibrio japonicus]ACE86077.1 oxidoreductase, short chain dehydrogenase/reductase family [Cellvibrio japonicus Ueda107]QEI12810.1 SDR family oxidoreductase [Cellvibrio japonicus]QEI16384.1 SDR family oxidoreductase [Cellvibrio japonicus]QEI19962.1 SDR family oxidoreductase [Cellvibrio japonicus]